MQTQQNCTSIPTSTARGRTDRAQTLATDLGRPFVAAPNEKGLRPNSRRSRDYMLICVIASAAKVFGYLFNESETHAATVTAQVGSRGSRSSPPLASYRAAKIKSLALGLVVTRERNVADCDCVLCSGPVPCLDLHLLRN